MRTLFVSSTFRDMDLERDAIQEIVSPALNREARRYGQSVSFCDLRWGIDTSKLESEDGSQKVLDVCLDEIDRCQPPMVVLLGYRFGWIPSAQLVQDTAERYEIELDDLEKSVTALEIEYGALTDPARLRNTLFYFREIVGEPSADYQAENPEQAARMQALKDRIRRMTGEQVKTYRLTWEEGRLNGIQAFCDMLCSDLLDRLLPEWKAYDAMSPFEKEIYVHETYLRGKADMFRARTVFAEHVLYNIEAGQRLTILKGLVGSGKSTLFSHLAFRLRESGWNVFPLFANLTTGTNTALEILQLMVYALEEMLGEAHFNQNKERSLTVESKEVAAARQVIQGSQEDAQEQISVADWQKRLEELCAKYRKTGKKLMLMLDAADQLIPDDCRDKLVFIPEELDEHVCFLMTCLPELNIQGNPAEMIPPVDAADKRRVIEGILAAHNRELSEEVIGAMLALEAADNPLYLSFVVQRLLMMNKADFEAIRTQGDGMAAISRQQLTILRKCPDSLSKMSKELLNAAAKRVGGTMVYRALTFLALAPHGLRSSDLAALLAPEFNQLDFTHFISYMSDCFLMRSDGRYDFSHKSLREGLIADCEDPKSIHRCLLAHFSNLDPEDPIRCQEIIHHCICADDKAFFVEYATKNYADKETMRHAAESAYHACLQDGGEWLCELLREAPQLEAGWKLSKFFYSYISRVAVSRIADFETVERILQANLEFIQEANERDCTWSSRFSLGHSYHVLADIYMEMKTKDATTKVLKLRQKQLEVFEELDDEDRSVISCKYLAEAHQLVAEAINDFLIAISQDMGESLSAQEEYKETVRSHMIRSLNLRKLLAEQEQEEQLWATLAEQYLALGREYSGWFFADPEKACFYVEQSRKILQKLYEIYGDVQYLVRMADACETLAAVYSGNNESHLVPEQYNRAVALREEALKKDRSPTARQKLAAAYLRQGIFTYEDDDKQKEEYCVRRAVELCRGLMEERGSISDQLNLATALAYQANLVSDEDRDSKGALLREAATLREELMKVRDDADNRCELAKLYQGLRDLAHLAHDVEQEAYYNAQFEQTGFSGQMNAYVELLEILRHMAREYVDMLPKSLIIFLYENCNLDYDFRMTRPLGEEKFLPATLNLLAMINRQYWKKDKAVPD